MILINGKMFTQISSQDGIAVLVQVRKHRLFMVVLLNYGKSIVKKLLN